MKNLSKFSLGLFVGIFLSCLLFSTFAIANTPIKLIINGQTIQCDVPPQNINGRILVPARFVAEPLGATVEWDGENRVVRITGTNGDTNNNQTIKPENEITDNNKENNNTNIPPLIIDNTHIDNGTPDWVTSESDIFERMNQDAPRMN